MPLYKIIVNPLAGKGHAATVAHDVERIFSASGVNYSLTETQHPGEAIDLARQAVREGYDVLVAVGGDGTTHEVINGMMSSSEGAACRLAVIPAGSGNDFAAVNQVPADVEQACQVVLEGKTRRVDIGRVDIDDIIHRYFDNTIGIGLDGLVAIETHKMPWLRGIPLYLLALLKTVFISLKPMQVEMVIDNTHISTRTLMVSIANGQREGGGFQIAPQALPDDGELDLLYTAVLKRLMVLRMIPLFLKGTHLNHSAVHTLRARNINITSADALYLHVDGEMLGGAAHKIRVEIVPGKLKLIAG